MIRRIGFALLLVLIVFVPVSVRTEDELSVVQSAVSIIPYGDTYRVYCFAQVHNDSQMIQGMSSGVFRLYNGETVIAEEEVDRLWPYYLEPGQSGYVFGTAVFNPDENGNPVMPYVTRLVYTFETMEMTVSANSDSLYAEGTIERTGSGGYLLTMTVENTGESMARNPVVAFGLYTQSGAMIYADGRQLEQIGIAPGSTIELRFPVGLQLAKQWDDYGVSPDEIIITASYREDED